MTREMVARTLFSLISINVSNFKSSLIIHNQTVHAFIYGLLSESDKSTPDQNTPVPPQSTSVLSHSHANLKIIKCLLSISTFHFQSLNHNYSLVTHWFSLLNCILCACNVASPMICCDDKILTNLSPQQYQKPQIQPVSQVELAPKLQKSTGRVQYLISLVPDPWNGVWYHCIHNFSGWD